MSGYDTWKAREPDPHEYDEPDDWEDEYDPSEDCGRWHNGRLGSVYYCRLAGTEFCDFECPLRDQ